MSDLAVAQFQRLVELVAWLSQRDSGGPVSYREAAARFGVSERAIRADLEVLAGLDDEYKPWLASLSVALVAGGFVVTSRGSFRRPFRLTPEEALVLAVGLTAARGGAGVARKLGRALRRLPDPDAVGRTYGVGPSPSAHVEQVLALARAARDGHATLEVLYCGLGREPAWRVVWPHQVVEHRGVWYVVAWCEKVDGWRYFRAERVLEARVLAQRFTPRADFTPVTRADGLLAADDAVTATVAFSPRIARWLRERYPDGREDEDGRWVVRWPVTDPAWLVREVLQYGAEAEVLAPEPLRDAVRRAVS